MKLQFLDHFCSFWTLGRINIHITETASGHPEERQTLVCLVTCVTAITSTIITHNNDITRFTVRIHLLTPKQCNNRNIQFRLALACLVHGFPRAFLILQMTGSDLLLNTPACTSRSFLRIHNSGSN